MRKYLRILANGREFLPQAGLAFPALLIYNLLNALTLSLAIPFLEILFAQRTVTEQPPELVWYSPASLKANGYYALDQAIQHHGQFEVLVGFCSVLGVSIFLKNAFRYLSAWLLAPMELGIIRNLRNRLFRHLSRLSVGYFVRKPKGTIMNILVNDVQIVRESVLSTLRSVINDPLTMIVFFFNLLFISWQLTLFALLILPITGLVIDRIAKSLKRRATKGQATIDKLIAILEEYLSGVRVVKAYGGEAYERGKFEQLNQRYMDTMTGFQRRTALASPLTEVISIFFIVPIILYGGSLILLNDAAALKPAEFIGFVVIFSQFLTPVKSLSKAVSKIQKAFASYDRIEDFLAAPIEATEQPGRHKIAQLQHGIRFEGVSFRYEQTDVLRDISFTLRKGETVALVGPSGGGKSTIADLLCRFYDPREGTIWVDQYPLAQLDGPSWRQLIGIVTQEGVLFNDTAGRNIAYAQTDAQAPAIEQAAQAAYAHEFIQEMEAGYATLLGERGGRLSGGQRQRIAIARALLKNPEVLVLDEATSALDSVSESKIQAALAELRHNRTVLM
jgi:subfamily B ATP-binding cassette protein MsbA